MDIIELLANGELGLKGAEIARRLRRRVRDVLRIIVILEQRLWLDKDPLTSCYRVSYQMMKLAQRAAPAPTLTSVASPVMRELSKRSEQSCYLTVRSGTQGVVILQQASSSWHISLGIESGTVQDLISSSGGRVLLAHLRPADRELALALRARIRSRSQLRSQLAEIVRRGFDTQRSPCHVAVTDVSVAVRGFGDEVLAALTVVYLHKLNTPRSSFVSAQRCLTESARELSVRLGWIPN